MKDTFMQRVAKLLSVKSIVTITLTAVFAVLALRSDVTGQDYLTVFLMVISFYFGTQSQKKQGGVDSAE
jgi:FtsH-binding integral membrane protein